MRLNGKISYHEEEVESGNLQPQELVVGYALSSKKKKSNKGIMLVAIDLNRLLSDQDPLDVVLHKDYKQKHPKVIVIDPPDAIKHLYNQQSMLQDVVDLNVSDCCASCGGWKPLVVDGSAKSRKLFLAYDQFPLSEIEPPMVLQEFVNHGGVLFKIYITGETIKVVRCFSLPNVSKHELAKIVGVFRFPRISAADDADLDPVVAELPPQPLLERLAREICRLLGLRLFNIDMIQEHGTRDVFYVIDINYFPGR